MKRESAVRIFCLGCSDQSRLFRVEAVVRDEQATTVVHGRVISPYGMPLAVRARSVRTSHLATLLARPRRPRSTTAPAIVFGVAVLAAAVNLVVAVGSGGGEAAFGAVLMGLLAAVSGRALRSRHRAAQSSRLVPKATWLWRRCWYCRRCGAVSLVTPTLSVTLPAANLATSLLVLAERVEGQTG